MPSKRSRGKISASIKKDGRSGWSDGKDLNSFTSNTSSDRQPLQQHGGRHNKGTHPTPLQRISHVACGGARLKPGVSWLLCFRGGVLMYVKCLLHSLALLSMLVAHLPGLTRGQEAQRGRSALVKELIGKL